MIISEALRRGLDQLTSANITSARLDCELILAFVTGQTRAWVLAHADDNLGNEQAQTFSILLDKRANHTPLVHLTGEREFYGLSLNITPDVLTPRIETETMVDWAVETAPQNSRLIDIGTGSGALAIAIAKTRPDLEVWATDISPTALDIARLNAARYDLNINFVQSDLLSDVNSVFETIVTNLPYLQTDADLMPEVQHEPGVALFGGRDGLELYRRFLPEVPTHLATSGHLYCECDPWQQPDLITAASQSRLKLLRQAYFITEFEYAQ